MLSAAFNEECRHQEEEHKWDGDGDGDGGWGGGRGEGGEWKKKWSWTASTQQRPLLSILILCPTTAAGIQFCLLCCQPEPMPRSLTARAPLSTQRRPCRPAAWLGKTIHMVSRAYWFPLPSITPYEDYRQCPSEKSLVLTRKKWFL